MATKFSTRKTQRFYYRLNGGDEDSYVLIYGDEVDVTPGASFKGAGFARAAYRGRSGAIRKYRIGGADRPDVGDDRTLEMYFLDVGQGDAAFIVTPNGTTILVDGGIRRTTTTDFLVWKYRLDDPANALTIDHLILSHADSDHVIGLIPLLMHPRISVNHVWHNGIGLFDSGFDTPLGDVANDRLTTLHSSLADLAGLDLTETFRDWTDAVAHQGAGYQALSRADAVLDVGDPAVRLEIVGPVRNADGTLDWLKDKSHTINGHSLTFRLVHDHVRVMFSGDMNVEGGRLLMAQPGAALALDSHVFKSPHHGSHEFHQPYLNAVRPLVTVVSSGDSPDHGHPRAAFLGGIGRAGRSDDHLIFSTEIAATFLDADDEGPPPQVDPETDPELMFATSALNRDARRRFKQALPGIINVRSNGREIFAARRVQAGYQWESYAPIDVTDFP